MARGARQGRRRRRCQRGLAPIQETRADPRKSVFICRSLFSRPSGKATSAPTSGRPARSRRAPHRWAHGL
eukprot:3395011-Pyramimonas_sp.AAC.1